MSTLPGERKEGGTPPSPCRPRLSLSPGCPAYPARKLSRSLPHLPQLHTCCFLYHGVVTGNPEAIRFTARFHNRDTLPYSETSDWPKVSRQKRSEITALRSLRVQNPKGPQPLLLKHSPDL